MTPEILDIQLDNLRHALAWLHLRQTDVPFASIGAHPQPIIQIRPSRACTALKLQPQYQATTTGRARLDGIEQVSWQATLHHCRVEWFEPVQQSLPLCRPYQAGAR